MKNHKGHRRHKRLLADPAAARDRESIAGLVTGAWCQRVLNELDAVCKHVSDDRSSRIQIAGILIVDAKRDARVDGDV